jgi:ribonuclease HI
MEVMAAVRMLRTLTRPCDIVLHTDSMHLITGLKRLSDEQYGGRTEMGRTLWQELRQLVKKHGRILPEYVRGHSGDPNNELVDDLARRAVLLREAIFERKTEAGTPQAGKEGSSLGARFVP